MIRQHVSVGDLSAQISAAIDQIGPVLIEAGLRDWHLSNTVGRGQLVDGDASVPVVIWRRNQRHRLTNGMRVQTAGQMRWGRHGLQLFADTTIVPIGQDVGLIARRQVRERARATVTNQKQLPAPSRIDKLLIVGPKNGSAAIEDAKSVLGELSAHIVVVRIAMAGPRVAADLTVAISNHRDADAVLVVRGGGAAHDLDAFDTPAMVDAIATHPVPVVAGIGHATNTTAFDNAVWQSAPTPSLAAQAIADLHKSPPATRPAMRPATPPPAPATTAVAPRPVAARPDAAARVAAPQHRHHEPTCRTRRTRRRPLLTAAVAGVVVVVAVLVVVGLIF